MHKLASYLAGDSYYLQSVCLIVKLLFHNSTNVPLTNNVNVWGSVNERNKSVLSEVVSLVRFAVTLPSKGPRGAKPHLQNAPTAYFLGLIRK